VRLRLYTSYSDLFELNWDLMRRVKPLFDRHEIDIPFPQRVIHSAKEVE
jgi:small conductance mechanosensitive channel